MVQLGNRIIADADMLDRLERHRRELLETELLEGGGAALVAAEFPVGGSTRFLRQVCRWGGYYGIAVRTINANGADAVRNAFAIAYPALVNGDAGLALNAINRLHHLGRPSFASKVLRFLRPQSAAVLDSKIHEETGIPLSVNGYGQLVAGCQAAVDHLRKAGIVNPHRPQGLWYVADIEAAFYADIAWFPQ